MRQIDPTKVAQTPPFDKPGLRRLPDGAYEAYYVAHVFAFEPSVLNVPAGSKVTFYVTSPDVVHGFFIPNTDINMMAVPGWVNAGDAHVPKPGDLSAHLSRVLRNRSPRHVCESRGTLSDCAMSQLAREPSRHRAPVYRHGRDRARRHLRRVSRLRAHRSVRRAGVVRLLPRAHAPRRAHGAGLHDVLHYGARALCDVPLRAARAAISRLGGSDGRS